MVLALLQIAQSKSSGCDDFRLAVRSAMSNSSCNRFRGSPLATSNSPSVMALQISSEPLKPVLLEYFATNSLRMRRIEMESAPPNSEVRRISAVGKSILPLIAHSASNKNGAIDAFSDKTCSSPATGIPERINALRTAPLCAGDLKITAISDHLSPSSK